MAKWLDFTTVVGMWVTSRLSFPFTPTAPPSKDQFSSHFLIHSSQGRFLVLFTVVKGDFWLLIPISCYLELLRSSSYSADFSGIYTDTTLYRLIHQLSQIISIIHGVPNYYCFLMLFINLRCHRLVFREPPKSWDARSSTPSTDEAPQKAGEPWPGLLVVVWTSQNGGLPNGWVPQAGWLMVENPLEMGLFQS